MNNFDTLIEDLSKTSLTKYTDENGKIHFTTKSPEQLEKEKEEKLIRERGPICSICNKRNKNYRVDINESLMCNRCYEKTWDEQTVIEEDITINVICPYCKNQLNIPHESKDECGCKAVYNAGFEDEFYYTVRFYKKKHED